MRTTVTLDADVEALIRQAMRKRGLSFKQALNQAIRTGLGRPQGVPVPSFHQRLFNLGRPRIDLIKALALVSQLDDQRTLERQRSP